jgi:ABC-type bacteriocin/lantibiotic exporter with double-glycine peptidase domain
MNQTLATTIGGRSGRLLTIVVTLLAWPLRWLGGRIHRPRRRMPVLLQMSATECGAACLAMVLCAFGRRTTVSECATRLSIGRDGATARAIAAAGRSYGLRVRAFSVEPDDLEHVPLPAIVHWNFDHFIVLERWSPRYADVIDPASGRRRLSAAELSEGLTGVVLACEPGAELLPRVTGRWAWLGYFRQYALHSPGILAQIVAASILLQICGLMLPLSSKVVLDTIVPQDGAGLLPVLGFGIVVLTLCFTVISYLRAALLVYFQGRGDRRMMLAFCDHLFQLPYRFFEQRTSGDLLMRLGSNAAIRDTLTSQSMSVILDGGLVVSYLALLLTQDLVFGGLVAGVGALQVILLLATNRRLHDLTQADLAAQGASQSFLVETLTGIATVKASGSEDRVLDRWSDLFATQLNVSLRKSHLSAIVETGMSGLRTFAPLALLWFGAQQVLAGEMSIGTMVALNALGVAALAPLASLVSNGQQLQLVAAHIERIADVFESDLEQERGSMPPAPALTGGIVLDRVCFRYNEQSPDVLRDISLRIEPGQKVALVGRTGSGKSTLARLLLALYLPSEGEIRYDDVPLREIELRSLRTQFGVVMQEPVLFSGSIRDNMTLADPGLSLAQVQEAARLAAIHEEITRLPMGYLTRLGEGGAGLSGGQRQRVALARALVRRPALLLLDEATSSLDVVTEARIEANLSRLGCTRIVIAHRLSTVRDADVILVIDDGEIVERGTHEELQSRGGYYARLVGSQGETPATLPFGS